MKRLHLYILLSALCVMALIAYIAANANSADVTIEVAGPPAVHEAPQTPVSSPPQDVFIWFNHEAQAAYLSDKQWSSMVELVFFFGPEGHSKDTGAIAKCTLSREYVDSYISKSYLGELRVPRSKCREVHP